MEEAKAHYKARATFGSTLNAIFGSIVLCFIPFYGGMRVYRSHQAEQNEECIEEYISDHHAQIKKEVEDFFDIQIRDTDHLFVDTTSSQERRSKESIMSYDPDTNTITVVRDKAMPFLERPTSWIVPIKHQVTTKGVYIHELGHVYTLQMMQELNEEGRLDDSFRYAIELIPTRSLIIEGIAEYFAVAIGENLPRLAVQPYTWRELEVMAMRKEHPEVGRYILEPILDTWGIQKGLEAILTQEIITVEEIMRPQKYQQRIGVQ